jgi:hypothetical protein
MEKIYRYPEPTRRDEVRKEESCKFRFFVGQPYSFLNWEIITEKTYFRKSPLTPLCQRGEVPPFCKGREGGIRGLMFEQL